MIQIMIWGICVVIIALGSIAKSTYTLTLSADKRDKSSGRGLFVIFFVLAALIFIASLLEGQEIQSLFSR
jgi:hypothetical protein